MKPIFPGLRFPLLAKELTELAARRRTYVIRVVYALLLFLGFVAGPYRMFAGYSSGLLSLGMGSVLFEALLVIQFVGIFLFLPAMASGVITQEKERDSLVLLFLTDLGPWEIILQKFIASLMPMFTFLLLGLPLIALVYAFGGVSKDAICAGVLILFLTCLQVGSISILSSAYCRTTVNAFICAYFLTFFCYVIPFLIAAIGYYAFDIHPTDEWIYCLFPPTIALRHESFSQIAVRSIPVALSALCFLVLARWYLPRRAFLPPGRRILNLFGRLDSWATRANRLVGGVKFGKEADAFPADEPIAWRETSKKALGQARYLTRLVVAVEIVVVAVAIAALGDHGAMSFLILCLWCGAMVILSAQGANLIVGERVHQTLEVLLTTPMSGREIVRQKARAMTRLMCVFFVPLMTVAGIEWVTSQRYEAHDGSTYFPCSILAGLIYLPLISWLSLWIGLRMRTRFRAIVMALGAIVAWCVVPLFVFLMINVGRDSVEWPLLFSPASIVAANENDAIHELVTIHNQYRFRADPPPFPIWAVALANFAVYGGIAWWIRGRCLSQADYYLRRTMR